MSALQPFLIAGSDAGLEEDKKSFLIPDKAFSKLENAYVWRDRVKKREGLDFLGRLRRTFSNQAQTVADGTGSYNIADLLASFRALEANAELDPGTVVITVDAGGGGETIFTDQGDGTLLRTSGATYQIDAGTYINYITGEINIVWDAGGTPPNLTTVDITYSYFPCLPVMGIITQETNNINFETSIVFDTIYAYTFDGANYNEYLSGSGITWDGSDAQFFWGANYRGSDASVKLLFVTNFNNTTGSPIRYTDNSTWTSLVPAVAAQLVQNEAMGTVVTPWTSFGPVSLSNTPVVPGTVTISVGSLIIYTDVLQDGTLSGTPPTNTGTINYSTGSVTLTISPALVGDEDVTATYQYETTYMFQARILIPYYGRLLALDTWEADVIGNSKQYYNRCRFSQIGDPTQSGAWISNIFGKGGFIDAPTNEEIISAIYFKNTLIVFFERSTWQLRYVGDYGLPFVWERISSDFGSESQFSSILFDQGVLGVGNRAIISSNSQTVDRIDLKIPEKVFTFRNDSEGKQRIHGTRDFEKELVYWCYNNATNTQDTQKFPNEVLVYNYRNNTFAVNKSNVTCFGTYDSITGDTWDSTSVFWDDDYPWDSPIQVKQFPYVLSGNAEGFIHKYGYDSEEDFSLTITSLDRSVTPLTLEIINHNLSEGDIIYITDMLFIDTATSTPVSSTLNNSTYYVKTIQTGGVYDQNNIALLKWNVGLQTYEDDFTYTPSIANGTYIGGGKAALLPRIKILTKDFNPFSNKGKQVKLGYVDFLNDVSETALVTINLLSNSATSASGTMYVGQEVLSTDQNPLFPAQSVDVYWNRFYANTFGQYISVEITYNEDQMNDYDVAKVPYVLNALTLWMKEGGRVVF